MTFSRALFVVLLFPVVAAAQDWAFSVASGPFLFGDFAESTNRIMPLADEDADIKHSLTADPRAGFAVGVERYFNQRLSLRLEATFTEAPLAVKTGSEEDAISLDVADLSVTTIALPFVFRFNQGGRLRPLVYAGLAYAMYDMERKIPSENVPLFAGTRNRSGGIVGAGLEWWWNDRIGARATASDIITDSPLERDDFLGPPPRSLQIKTAHNYHGAAGVIFRF